MNPHLLPLPLPRRKPIQRILIHQTRPRHPKRRTIRPRRPILRRRLKTAIIRLGHDRPRNIQQPHTPPPLAAFPRGGAAVGSGATPTVREEIQEMGVSAFRI